MVTTTQLLVDLITLTLAAGAVVDVLRNGSLFAEKRAYLEARSDAVENRQIERGFIGWLGELFLCSYCLSYHAPFWLAVLFLAPAWWAAVQEPPCLVASFLGGIISGAWLPASFLGPAWWAALLQPPWPLLALLWRLPLYALACTRLGNVLIALRPALSYERHDE